MKLSKEYSSKQKPKTEYLSYSDKNSVFEAIGTIWNISIKEHVNNTDLEALNDEIRDRVEIFDRNYSRFRSDSLITQISEKAGNYKLPGDAKPMFDLYYQLYKLTSGLMTPLIGNLLSDAGYDKDYTFFPKKLDRPPSWDETLAYNYPNLTVKRPVLLDFGAAGKGYLIDLIARLIETYKIANFSVYAGGDILVRSSKNFTTSIGLEHPEKTDEMVGVAEISNQSICGSAANRRIWGNYHHIFNPKTLKPTNKVKAVWVVTESALYADGLATALFFTDAQKLLKSYPFEYALILNDFSLEQSKNFPADFFTAPIQRSPA